ncbi:MAG: helix-turn-helix domain-containing protein [bacterium]|nr:helix-turn-helix domain-containing protein [bacterium]
MSLQKDWCYKELMANEASANHRPMEDEYSFYHAVKTGDIKFVKKNLEERAFSNLDDMGILSMNPLTNMKYHFVITVAMITRHCVEGGLELEQSYRLSDFYILKMDSCDSVEEITKLHDIMVLDYTEKMQQFKKNAILSKPITLCIDYIYNHLHDRITVKDLALYTDLSESYLSRLFKKELNISISDYIREKKIETAQNLLMYSNYSFIDISNYLAFSSQSHFIQTFVKQVGTTPKKYRDQYYRTSW